jgi:pseudouridine-5'-phosphate glycosidase/sugar/nucleoside kinase (ribokinase family)
MMMLGRYGFRGVSHIQRGFSTVLKGTTGSIIQIDEAVQDALANNRPVVALESTIVAHGMPYPENLNLAKTVASILRSKGVEPATIAVRDGVCRVGITPDELEDLARAGGEGRAQKCSTRELSLILANQKGCDFSGTSQWGATTVASTMTLAHAAGIPTFVTGGIGGVHRHGEVSMDISADLTELARTPVIVVSGGIKSILDIERTLQVLETNGVPTVAYQTDEFPAFFSPHSGVPAPARMDNPDQVAWAYWAARNLNLPHGMMVAVPNQDPAGANVEEAIHSALAEADEQGIHGQAVTPFLLKRIAEITGGDSLRSNMALVKQNAEVGADIAIAICKQRQQTQDHQVAQARKDIPRSRVIVMGGTVLDIMAKPLPGQELLLETSNPATCTESDGGVGRNIAEVLGRLGSNPLFYSSVGNDARGLGLLSRLVEDCGVQAPRSTVRVVDDANTATYLAVLNGKGDLMTACADMTVLEHIKGPSMDVLEGAEIVVMDANAPVHILRETALRARQAGVKVCFEPTSAAKTVKVAQDKSLMSNISFAFPNFLELGAMLDSEESKDMAGRKLYHKQIVKVWAEKILDNMNPDGAHLVVTMGEDGVVLASKEPGSAMVLTHFEAKKVSEVKNTSGAGDTLCGAFIHAILNGKSVSEAVSVGMEAATISIQCGDKAISPLLSNFKY